MKCVGPNLIRNFYEEELEGLSVFDLIRLTVDHYLNQNQTWNLNIRVFRDIGHFFEIKITLTNLIISLLGIQKTEYKMLYTHFVYHAKGDRLRIMLPWGLSSVLRKTFQIKNVCQVRICCCLLLFLLIKNDVAGDGLDTENISIKFLPPSLKR